MGRVRRYKKIKSFDPFAKKKKAPDGSVITKSGGKSYDLPPDVGELYRYIL